MNFETAFVDDFALETCGCAFRSTSVAPNAIRQTLQKPRWQATPGQPRDSLGTASGQPRRKRAKPSFQNWIKLIGAYKHDLITS